MPIDPFTRHCLVGPSVSVSRAEFVIPRIFEYTDVTINAHLATGSGVIDEIQDILDVHVRAMADKM
jgi:hypothetical protein